MMNSLRLEIGLKSWIIQDGNYPEFAVGEQVDFALEFYARDGFAVSEDTPRLEPLGDARYRACGVVRYTAADVWVVDFDSLLAFRQEAPPPGANLGSAVAGEIWIGVDPFFYFEDLFRRPGIPALIYRWRIERIAIETAPFVESRDKQGRCVLTRDASQHRVEQRQRTDAWNDDRGHGDYVLTCMRMSFPPSLKRTLW